MREQCVIAAIDLQHEDSDRIIAEEALALARNHGAELCLVYVIPDQQESFVQAYIPAEMKEQVTKDAKASLEAFSKTLEGGEITIKTKVLRGIVYQRIIELADKLKAKIVVVGANKPAFVDYFLGPNAARVARHTECSVMIVRPERG